MRRIHLFLLIPLVCGCMQYGSGSRDYPWMEPAPPEYRTETPSGPTQPWAVEPAPIPARPDPAPRSEAVEARIQRLEESMEELNQLVRQNPPGGEGRGVRVKGTPTDAPKIDGAVLGVGSKSGLVMLNVGEKAGVKVGYEFTVYRGNTYVGKVVVMKVYPERSTSRILPDMTKGKVMPGDKVSTQVY